MMMNWEERGMSVSVYGRFEPFRSEIQYVIDRCGRQNERDVAETTIQTLLWQEKRWRESHESKK